MVIRHVVLALVAILQGLVKGLSQNLPRERRTMPRLGAWRREVLVQRRVRGLRLGVVLLCRMR